MEQTQFDMYKWSWNNAVLANPLLEVFDELGLAVVLLALVVDCLKLSWIALTQ